MRPITILSIVAFICLFTQCIPDGPNYSVVSYEGTITVTTDSAITDTYSALTINRSKSYTNFIHFNGVNYEFLSNGNHLIIEDTLQKEINGFLYADGELFIINDSLTVDLHVSQFANDSTLYFQTRYQGKLGQI